MKRIFDAEDFIHIGTPEQAELIAKRCQEILEMYGFDEFLKANTVEWESHKEDVAKTPWKYIKKVS